MLAPGYYSVVDPQSPEEHATHALRHVLLRIRNDPAVGRHMGYGTESFRILTEAYAALCRQPLVEVCELFMPTDPECRYEEAS
ncbi:MAG TPA: hypothetical protein VFW88_07755 [Burkholderiales bacterium]|nr:hypothetical protein [Burkholderiales bacterium]